MVNKKLNLNNQVLLKWQIHPLRQNLLKGIITGIFILVISIYSGLLLNNALFFVIILIVFFIFVLLPYYFPTKFILTEKKIVVINGPFKKEYEWANFRRFNYDKKILKLYTSLKPSKLDNYRTLNLVFDNNYEQVIEIVKKKLEK